MSAPDIANASFEALGAAFVLNHCRIVLRYKAVAGVSILSTCFFASWGVWNLWYYPHLGQWWSFGAGAVLACTNAIWIALMMRYRSRA